MKVNSKNIILGIQKAAKSVIVCMTAVIVMAALILADEIEANARPQGYTLTAEDIRRASSRSAGKADEIMFATDFLDEGERAADYEDIQDYLTNLETEGIKMPDEWISMQSDLDLDDNESAVTFMDKDENIAEESDDTLDITEDIDDNDVDISDWRLILVNKQNPVPDNYDAKLGYINNSMQADARIIDDIYAMLDAAERDGVDLMICSAYRSYDRQTTLFNNKIRKLLDKGMSYLDAYAVGSMSVTVPGTSEHQLGMALDILTPSYTEMDDGFGETEAGIWLKDNASEYGFILRYPAGKEEITGIIYEPWHFRYVSTEYSKEITELGITLEEYVNGEY